MRRLWSILTSTRTTVAVLIALGVLLLLNVAIPQDTDNFRAAHDALVASGAVARFVVVTLGFGHMPTSPIFLGVLALFFVNLAAVLEARIQSTIARLRLRLPDDVKLAAWMDRSEGLSATWPAGLDEDRPRQVLTQLGYRVHAPGPRQLWAVKNRLAILGFPLFHLSFFLMCAGGMLLFYTRFTGGITLTEGQRAVGQFSGRVQPPLVGTIPSVGLTLDKVEPVFERGRPIQLRATVRLDDDAGGEPRTASINHPVKWDQHTLLVDKAGLSAILWLKDSAGHTVDRVAAPVQTAGETSVVPLDEGRLGAALQPVALKDLGGREALTTTEIALSLLRGDQKLVEGRLRPGHSLRTAEHELTLVELRYWAGLRLVSERGGNWLIAGFVLAVVGIVWRMLWYRREVGAAWDGHTLRLAGRCEFFPRAFRAELAAIRDLIVGGAGGRA